MSRAQPKIRLNFRDRRLHIFLIAALSILVYSNIFNAPFFLDDYSYILQDPAVRDMSYFMQPSRMDSVTTMPEGIKQNFKTRIVGYLTFALNYKLNGFNVQGYHLFNLAVHLINALLLYLLLLLIFKTPYFQEHRFADEGLAALFASLLFAVHPIQNQAVVYISQRFASLVALFYLLSLVFYLKFRIETRRKYLFYSFALASMLMSVLTKENAFTLPFTAALLEAAFFKGDVKKRVFPLLPFFLLSLTIPVIIYSIGAHAEGMGGALRLLGASQNLSRWDYLFTQFRVLVTYLRLLVLPIGQNLDYDYPLFKTFLAPQVLVSFLFLSVLFIWAVYLSFSKKRKANPYLHLIGVGLLWFFITLSVESSFFPLLDLIFEYRLYLPSAGFFIGLTGAIFYLGEVKISKKAIFSAFTAVIIILSVAAFARNSVWRSNISLWEDVARKSPMKVRAHLNLGVAYNNSGFYQLAVIEYQKAISLVTTEKSTMEQTDLEILYSNLGMAFVGNGDIEQAKIAYEKALEFNPDYVLASNALAVLYIKEGREKEGAAILERTIGTHPDLIEPYLYLSYLYRKNGQFDKCMDLLQTALKYSPDSPEAHFEMGMLLFAEGRGGADVEFKTALALRPGYRQAEEMLITLSKTPLIPPR